MTTVKAAVKRISDSYLETWVYQQYPRDPYQVEKETDDTHALYLDWFDKIDLAQEWIDSTGQLERVKDLRSEIELMACYQLDEIGYADYVERVEAIQQVIEDLEADAFTVVVSKSSNFGWEAHVRETERMGHCVCEYVNVEGEIDVSVIEIDGIFLDAFPQKK